MDSWLKLCFVLSLWRPTHQIDYKSVTEQCAKRGRVELALDHWRGPRHQLLTVNRELVHNWNSRFDRCDIIVRLGDGEDKVEGRYGLDLKVMFWGWGWGGKLGQQQEPKISIYFSRDTSGFVRMYRLAKAEYEGIVVDSGTTFSTTNATHAIGDTIHVTLGENQAKIDMIFSVYRVAAAISCHSNERRCKNSDNCVAKELENDGVYNCPVEEGGLYSGAGDEWRVVETTTSSTPAEWRERTKNGANRPVTGLISSLTAVAVAALQRG